MIIMRKLKIFLIPIMAIIELLIIATAWCCAFIGLTVIAERITKWAMSWLPRREWYFD